jgi:hypothetical protein
MDFGLALTFQFKDPAWIKKLFLAGLISMIPVLGWFFVLGWSLEITRGVIKNESQELPEIDLVEDLMRGIKGFAISFIYSLPSLIGMLPVGIVAVFGFVFSTADRNGIGSVATAMVLFCFFGIALVYGILINLLIPAAFGNFLAKDGNVTAGFELRNVIRMVRNAPVAYFLVLVGQFLCFLIACLGLAACLIGVVFTSTYTMTVMGHLYGQAYKEARRGA